MKLALCLSALALVLLAVSLPPVAATSSIRARASSALRGGISSGGGTALQLATRPLPEPQRHHHHQQERRALQSSTINTTMISRPPPSPPSPPPPTRLSPSPRPPPIRRPPSPPRPPPSPRPPSPSPPPSPPPSPYRVCGTVNLLSPVTPSGLREANFGKEVSCDDMSSRMALDFENAAVLADARVAVPFAMESCSAAYDPSAVPLLVLPYIRVCGSFVNAIEADKIQGQVLEMLVLWHNIAVGMAVRDLCPPPGYTVEALVESDGGGLPAGYFGNVACHSDPQILP